MRKGVKQQHKKTNKNKPTLYAYPKILVVVAL
jgi:hypothetical protein